jgi:hypothetical protein
VQVIVSEFKSAVEEQERVKDEEYNIDERYRPSL